MDIEVVNKNPQRALVEMEYVAINAAPSAIKVIKHNNGLIAVGRDNGVIQVYRDRSFIVVGHYFSGAQSAITGIIWLDDESCQVVLLLRFPIISTVRGGHSIPLVQHAPQNFPSVGTVHLHLLDGPTQSINVRGELLGWHPKVDSGGRETHKLISDTSLSRHPGSECECV